MAQKKPLGAGDPDKAGAKLERIVKEKLENDERLRGAQLMVRADVTRNTVTLSGSVPTDELRERAIEVARGAQAGVVVNDRIEVKPVGSDARRQRKTIDV